MEEYLSSYTGADIDAAVASVENGIKSVLDYGADPTGATDSTSAFVAAISDNAGEVIYVPAGTYLVSETGSTGSCIQFAHSITILMSPEAVLKLDTDQDVPILMIGDNATAFSGVTIIGGTLDGDADNSTITPKVRTSLLEVHGPVSDVTVRNVRFQNANLGAVEVGGTDTDNRAARINFEMCPINNVTEGVVIQFTNEFHWRGGDITNITMQDCFEPHGGIDGWSLRDCTISDADPSNSEVEIYPQVGDILHGVVENVRILGEMRISLSSAATYEVNGVSIRSCAFENGLIYAGVGDGRFRGVVVDGCEFIGPASNVPRTVPSSKSAIHAFGADNRMDVLNSRVFDYDGTGLYLECDEANIIGNTVFNNGQAGASMSSYLRCGIYTRGDNVLVMGNRVYDDQGTKTQIYTPQIRGDFVRIIGNHFTDATTITRSLGSGWISIGNIGDFIDTVDTYVTMPSGQSWVNMDYSLFPGLWWSGDFNFVGRLQVTPMDNMAPASRYWLTATGGNVRINTDAPVTSDTRFRVVMLNNTEQADATS